MEGDIHDDLQIEAMVTNVVLKLYTTAYHLYTPVKLTYNVYSPSRSIQDGIYQS